MTFKPHTSLSAAFGDYSVLNSKLMALNDGDGDHEMEEG